MDVSPHFFMLHVPDCWGCRQTSARYCAHCVAQAVSERHARLREFDADKERLEAAMEQGLAARDALLRQRASRRAHRATVADLQSRLDYTKRDTERLAEEVRTSMLAVRGLGLMLGVWSRAEQRPADLREGITRAHVRRPNPQSRAPRRLAADAHAGRVAPSSQRRARGTARARTGGSCR